jgi:hypothetical protein
VDHIEDTIDTAILCGNIMVDLMWIGLCLFLIGVILIYLWKNFFYPVISNIALDICWGIGDFFRDMTSPVRIFFSWLRSSLCDLRYRYKYRTYKVPQPRPVMGLRCYETGYNAECEELCYPERTWGREWGPSERGGGYDYN